MDISRLFDEPSKIRGYEDELAAIEANHKAMSVFTGQPGDAYFEEIEKKALDLKLILVTSKQSDSAAGQAPEQVNLFVTKSENLWRVQAYTSFLSIMRRYQPWSDGAEHFQSFLLGYGDEQIAEWVKYKKNIQLAWGTCTIYFCTATSYAEKLKLLGNRCFHPECDEEGIVLFFPKKHLVPNAEAYRLLPIGTMIGRLAVSWRTAHDVFGGFENMVQGNFAKTVLACQMIPSFNSGVRSAIEILDENGWS